MSEKRLAELKGAGTGRTCSSGRRGKSAVVERFGFSIADASRQFAFRSNQPQAVVQMVQCRRGRAVEKNLFLSVDEEMEEWMAGRHKDLQAAMESGKTPRGCEGLSVDDERSQRVAPVDSGTDHSTVNIGEHGEVILHQCGFLGVRVGEASHPWSETQSSRQYIWTSPLFV